MRRTTRCNTLQLTATHCNTVSADSSECFTVSMEFAKPLEDTWRDSLKCHEWRIRMRFSESQKIEFSRKKNWLWGPPELKKITWVTQTNAVCHSYVWRDSCICGTWLIGMCDMTHSMCDMTHSCAWRDLLICVTWRICVTCNVRLWYESLICVTTLIHICDMTHSQSCACYFYMCDMTHS